MLTEILHRLRHRASRQSAPRRTEIIPPALLQGAGALVPGWRVGLREWLSTGWHAPSRDPACAAPHAGSKRLQSIRDEFLDALHDVRTQQAGMLQERIRIARSLRELWHLRPEVFGLVALRYSQAEAQLRLDRLNRHFPTRAPRSGFAPLDSAAPAAESRTLPGRR
jgi:hypothetical protein